MTAALRLSPPEAKSGGTPGKGRAEIARPTHTCIPTGALTSATTAAVKGVRDKLMDGTVDNRLDNPRGLPTG